MPEGNKPSGVRNFFGGVVDRILPGSNYNRSTGQYSNIGKGIAGRGASIIGSMLGGPAVGALINKGAGKWIDTGSPLGNGYGTGPLAKIMGRDATDIGEVVPQPIGDGRPVSPNLGLGNAGPQGVAPGQLYRDPYMGWQQFMAPQGSVGNFGNNNIRTQPVPGAWQPKSGWGRDMMAGGNAGMAGANRGFGNSHFSSGRGGAQTVDSGAAGDITAWLGGGASGGTSKTPFSRAIK
jgi:hypothetical protein